MNIFDNIYLKALGDNEKNLRFWDDYLLNLKALDFSVFAEKLKVSALVPVGSRIFFKGEIKHTNEVTTAIGADYFVKCSIKQADILRQHRMRGAQSKVEELQKEKSYLESQLSFNKQNLFEERGHEIVEQYSEEEDKLWRVKHRENMRLYKQKAKTVDRSEKEATNEELWDKLEELELQEELENELENMSVKEKVFNSNKVICKKDPPVFEEHHNTTTKENLHKTVTTLQENKNECDDPKSNFKLDLIQKVFDKQILLEEKLHELKYKEQKQSKTEKDLIAKLDEMEQLDELEDELDRLEDILESDDIIEENERKEPLMKLKRSVSFADENEMSDTIELTITHSKVEPNKEPYNPKKGILKPSDLYEAHNQNLSETTSILKKSKYNDYDVTFKEKTTSNIFQTDTEQPEDQRTIIVNDITETVSSKDSMLESKERPASLFKMKRQQRKMT